MKTDIGITAENLKKINALLSNVLADEMTLYIKTRKFHWNVSGESFMELHKLFEGQYKQLEEYIDEVAERIGKMGGKAIGTMFEFSALSKIKESPGKYPGQKNLLKELLSDNEMLVKELRNHIENCNSKLKDAGTADFLTGLMKEHETMCWVLRRYLD